MPGVTWGMPFESSAPDPGVRISWSFRRSAVDVFSHLTATAGLPEWLGKPLEADWSEGGAVRIDHGDGYICESVVLASDREAGHIRLSWKFPDEPQTVLSLTVQDAERGSRLLLHHEGLADLRGSYEAGWLTHLSYFEASLEGQALSPGQFWNLHGTLAALLNRTSQAR